jgi:hypothetical protein
MNDSFALPEQKAVFSQETAAPVTPQVGLSGGNISGGLQLRDPSKDTPGLMDTLFNFAVKVGDKKFSEYMEKEKERKFMEGVGRVASGEAAKDIEASQPWWSRLFGDGNVVAGARAWEGITDANQLESSILDNMHSLRELPPEQAQRALLDIRRQLNTGDPDRDAATSAVFVKSLPGVLKTHAKQHAAYQQEVATEAQRKGIQSSMRNFEAKVSSARELDNSDDSDLNAPRAELKALFTPPPGVNPGTYSLQLVEGMANSMALGEFSTYSEAKKQGLLDNLPKQYARQLEQLHDSEARKVAFDRAPQHLKDRLFSIEGMDAAQTVETLNAVNTEFMQASGLEIPLVPTEKYQTLVQRAARKDEAKAAAAARKAEREDDKTARAEARTEERNAKLAVQIADEQANVAAAEVLVNKILDDPRPGSAAVGLLAAKGSDALKYAKERLPLVAGERWSNPPLTQAENAQLAAIQDPTQRSEATRALQASHRNALLQKDGVDMTVAREQIRADLSKGNYAAANDVIDALAFGAEGSGMEKLNSKFAKLVPEEQRPLMTAYIAALGAQSKRDAKGNLVVDHAALWAGAEASVALTSRKPATAKQIQEIRGLAVKEAGGFLGFFKDEDQDGTQANALLADTASRLFDGRVTADNLSPAKDALERAKERIQVLGGSGVAYLRNPQAERPIHDDVYVGKLPAADQAYLSTPDRVGFALKYAAEARKVPLEANTRVYRADDTPSGAPYFVVLGSSPGSVEVISMADLLEGAKRHHREKFPFKGGEYQPGLTDIIAP